jgi:hypothetical protein
MPGIMQSRIKQHRLQGVWGCEYWTVPSRPPNGTHHVRDTLNSWATTLVQDSAESKATRHLDSPTDGGLEYLMSGNPQWPCLNHFLQFKHTLHFLVRNIRDGRVRLIR